MPREPNTNEPPAHEVPHENHDAWFVGSICLYSAFNVGLMLLFAYGWLGRVPFELIAIFLVLSALGALGTVPVWLFVQPRAGVSGWRCLAAVVAFGLLTWFNYFCLLSASAAV
jgi:hypothetical protein